MMDCCGLQYDGLFGDYHMMNCWRLPHDGLLGITICNRLDIVRSCKYYSAIKQFEFEHTAAIKYAPPSPSSQLVISCCEII